MSPRFAETAFDRTRPGDLALPAQRLEQPEQRPAVVRQALEVLPGPRRDPLRQRHAARGRPRASDALRIESGQATQALGDLAAGGMVSASWLMRADEEGQATIGVDVVDGAGTPLVDESVIVSVLD